MQAISREQDYINLAKKIAEESFASNTPLEEVAVKAASDYTLGPEQIRTLVKLSNVAAFKQHYASKEGADRSVEFKTASPEAVIARIHDNVKTAAVVASTGPYSATLDYYTDLDWGEPLEKAAEEAPHTQEPTYNREQVITKLRHATKELELRKEAAAQEWHDTLVKAASWVRLQSTNDLPGSLKALEDSVLGTLGKEASAELAGLRVELRQAPTTISNEKVAHLQEHLVVTPSEGLDFIKHAFEVRDQYAKYSAGLLLLATKTANVGG